MTPRVDTWLTGHIRVFFVVFFQVWEALQTRVDGISACPVGFNTLYTDGVGAENYIAAAASVTEAALAAKKGAGARVYGCTKGVPNCCSRVLWVYQITCRFRSARGQSHTSARTVNFRVFASTFSRCSVREKCCSTMTIERDTMVGLVMDLPRLSHYSSRSQKNT
jgi:hypothetical protein